MKKESVVFFGVGKSNRTIDNINKGVIRYLPVWGSLFWSLVITRALIQRNEGAADVLLFSLLFAAMFFVTSNEFGKGIRRCGRPLILHM